MKFYNHYFFNCTALHLATRLKQADILRLLLLCNEADITLKDSIFFKKIKQSFYS